MPSKPRDGELTPIADLVPKSLLQRLKPFTPIEERLLKTAAKTAGKNPFFMPRVFCQICLPYRNPGDQIREWHRRNGNMKVSIYAGDYMDPVTQKDIYLGLPYGIYPRLLNLEITKQAIRSNSPVIDMNETLTTFVRKNLGQKRPNGRIINNVRAQLARLAGTIIQIQIVHEERTTRRREVLTNQEIWVRGQKIAWPETLILDSEYFNDVVQRPVPLDDDHINALSHNPMALDIYCWGAYRLPRLGKDEILKLSWNDLWWHFGQGYNKARLDKFHQVFMHNLKQVKKIWTNMRFEERGRGPRRSYVNAAGKTVIREAVHEGLIFRQSESPVPRAYRQHIESPG